ncbi:MAG: M48 family metalloprotease [Lentisphaeria bacterium]|nr:M48 family metalloprotease [Lentisphaeria bacterium]
MRAGEIRIASEEVRANYIKTVVLLVLMAACIVGLSWLLGDLLGDLELGLTIGGIVCVVVIPLELLFAKFAVIHLTGCKRANPNNLQQRRIIQLVEGLALSAGLPKVPDVYIMNTDIPNAFAAGWGPDSAMVAVTQGLADMMDDQELEGVIAHEIAHIVHRDVMVCQIAASMQTAMLVLAEVIQWVGYFVAIFASTRSRSDRNDDNGKEVIAGLLVYLLIKPVTWFISTILTMSISRKREYAADAFAVRLCSYNEGLARALEKLSGDAPRYNGEIADALGGNAVAPMYIYYPLDSLFSTHPSTKERIRRLRNMV